MRRWRRAMVVGCGCLALYLLGVMAVVVVRAQSSDLERRIGVLEDLHVERRLTAIETRLESIETVGKAIFTAVLGQLAFIVVFSLRRRSDDSKPRSSWPRARGADDEGVE